MFTSTPFAQPQGGEGTFGALTGLTIRQSVSRNRQSYAYPLQQVFEDTRSMLMNEGEPSVFETTVARSRMTLAPAGVDDFIGAMDALHEQFGVTIDCMTNRSQIFEVINIWIRYINDAVQHEKSNETDLSDSNYRKLQSLLQLECETWNLISVLYYQRLNDEENVEVFDSAIRDKFCVNEEPYIQNIVESDNSLKEMICILRWLEANFEKYGPPDLSEKFFIWENTLETLKKDQLLNKSSTKSMVSKVDPDAPTREGKQLHPLDQEETSKVLKGAFYYIRTGNIEAAISYLVKSGERFKAAAMSGYQWTLKVQQELETGEEQGVQKRSVLPSMEYLPKAKRQARPNPDFDIRGNPKRDLWKQVTWKVCEKNALSKYDRALLGSLCGHRPAMLNVAQTWEDRLWAYLKAAVDVMIERRLRSLSSGTPRCELPESYWSQNLSVPDCIAKVESSDSNDTYNIPEAVFQSLQKYVMMDQIGCFIEELELENSILTFLNSYDHPLLNGHVVRFCTHLLLFLGVVNLPYSQELMDVCVERYITVLVDTNLITKTPYYIQKLSEEKKIPTIVQHIGIDRKLTREEIQEFFKGAHLNELNVLAIGKAVVDKLRDEEEDFTVENLDWISCCYEIADNPSEVMYEFLRYTIWISRKYLTLGNIEKVQKLIHRLTPDSVSEVAQISEILENTLVREYVCYKVYLEAEAALTLWQKALAQRPDMDEGELPLAATKADRTVFEKRQKEVTALHNNWRKAVDYHLNCAIQKFLDILRFPLGWLHKCYDESDEDEQIHVGAVRKIIIRKVIHILLRLVKDKNDNRTTRDFLYVICDEKINILSELSQSEIGNILIVIETFTRQKVTDVMFLPK